jgi:hypothetical protein
VAVSAQDPERSRALALAERVGRGIVTESEMEELALLVADRTDLRQAIDEEVRRRSLGAGWLERVEADRKVRREEQRPLALIERASGMGLVVLGFVTSPLLPALSAPAMIAGTGLIAWSLVRVKLKTYKNDPYRNIDQ